jgi:hypothetical protein
MAKLPALPFIRAGLSQGLNQADTLRQYRAAAAEAGLTGMRTHDFQRLYNEIGALRGQAGQAIEAPKDIPGGGLQPRPWSTQDKSGFIHWVSIYQTERATGALIHMPYAIKSDRILTPAEAEQRTLDFLSTQPDNYNRRTIGVTFSGLAELQPRGDMYQG